MKSPNLAKRINFKSIAIFFIKKNPFTTILSFKEKFVGLF